MRMGSCSLKTTKQLCSEASLTSLLVGFAPLMKRSLNSYKKKEARIALELRLSLWCLGLPDKTAGSKIPILSFSMSSDRCSRIKEWIHFAMKA